MLQWEKVLVIENKHIYDANGDQIGDYHMFNMMQAFKCVQTQWEDPQTCISTISNKVLKNSMQCVGKMKLEFRGRQTRCISSQSNPKMVNSYQNTGTAT